MTIPSNELTREQVLALCGNQLSLYVHVHVMSCTPWEEKRGEYLYVVFQKPGEREPYRSSQRWESEMHRYRKIGISEIDFTNKIVCGLPEYSSDISAAIKAAEKMGTWQLTKMEIATSTRQYKAIVKANKNVAYAEFAAEALSKGAILAVMGI